MAPNERGRRVLLVVPPFRSVVRPALGVSQLKANLVEQGFPTEIVYLNLRLASILGAHLYEALGADYRLSLGDFLFSCLLFGRSEEDVERYVREIVDRSPRRSPLLETVPRARMPGVIQGLVAEIDAFADEAAEELSRRRPMLVGVTSSYQENLAALLLLQRLKQRDPGIATAMGGANCHGEMGEELFARFPQVDHVALGEADLAIVDLAGRIANGELAPTPGFLSRGSEGARLPPRLLESEDLERQPVPDFRDFFEQLDALPCREQITPGLVMETARGCWWGAVQLCTFCGLNGEGLAFRSKSGPRVLDEMVALIKEYGIPSIEIVDNIIDKRYFRDLFPRLAAEPPAALFWEATSSLPKPHVALLAAANVRHIQAGIESLSDRSLRLMRKPTSVLRNVQMLKWCRELGISLLWSHLFGFPGEDEGEGRHLAAVFERIHHLKPPAAAHLVRLQRFSPYHESAEQYGFAPYTPSRFYQHLYPFPQDALARIAYHFESDLSGRKAESAFARELTRAVERWRRAHRRSHLVTFRRRETLIVVDTRSCARRRVWRLRGLERRIFECCDGAATLAGIARALDMQGREPELEAAVRRLVDGRLMLQTAEHHLSLATAWGAERAAGRPGRRMPGGNLEPIRARELPGLLRRLRATPASLARTALHRLPGVARLAFAEAMGRALLLVIALAARVLADEPSG